MMHCDYRKLLKDVIRGSIVDCEAVPEPLTEGDHELEGTPETTPEEEQAYQELIDEVCEELKEVGIDASRASGRMCPAPSSLGISAGGE